MKEVYQNGEYPEFWVVELEEQIQEDFGTVVYQESEIFLLNDDRWIVHLAAEKLHQLMVAVLAQLDVRERAIFLLIEFFGQADLPGEAEIEHGIVETQLQMAGSDLLFFLNPMQKTACFRSYHLGAIYLATPHCWSVDVLELDQRV